MQEVSLNIKVEYEKIVKLQYIYAFSFLQCPWLLQLVQLHPSPPRPPPWPYLPNPETSCPGPLQEKNPANSSMWSPLRRRRWLRPTAQTKRELAAERQETELKDMRLHLENMLVRLSMNIYTFWKSLNRNLIHAVYTMQQKSQLIVINVRNIKIAVYVKFLLNG